MSPASRQNSLHLDERQRLLHRRVSTTAHTRSPRSRSGRPITATAATFGCVWSRSSISRGLMFSPLRMMISLRAAGEHEVAVVAQEPAVAGGEEAVVAERGRGELGIGVALGEHRPAHPHLAGRRRPVPACRRSPTTCTSHPSTGAPSVLASCSSVVVERALRDHRALGHAVAVADRDVHLGAHLAEHLGRLRRAAAVEQPQRRDHRLRRVLALLVEEREVERGAAAGHRDAVAREHRRRRSAGSNVSSSTAGMPNASITTR